MKIIVRTGKHNPYPPYGKSISAPTTLSSFAQVAIVDRFKPFRLKPVGARQSIVEARILSKIKAQVNGLASLNGDLIGR